MNEDMPVISNNSVNTDEINQTNMNFLKRVFGIIFSPSKVMQSLDQKPRVLFGLLLTAITPVIMILLTLPMYMEYSRKLLEVTYANMNIEMNAEQMEQAVNISQYSALFGGPVAAVVMLLLEALVVWGIVKVLKGKGSFKQYLSVLGYTNVIAVLSTITLILVVRFTGTYTDVSYTSLASLLPNMKGSFLFGFAKIIEVFTIWQYVVIGIGISTVSKLSNKKVFILVACIFVVIAIYMGVTEVNAAKLLQ